MLFTLAILPSIVLMVYIYKKDKKEKEPMRLLMTIFIFGIISVFPVSIVETLIGYPVDALFTPGSHIYAFFDAFLVAALVEEGAKYIIVKTFAWRSREFDYMFDGIVYAVFSSLGFATFENIFYVIDGGFSTAISRMLTSVPGHTCFGVWMGYYISKAKLSAEKGDLNAVKINKRKALIVPIILHGIYDFCIMVDESVVGGLAATMAVLEWVVFVIIMFVMTFRLVNKASKEDEKIRIAVFEED